MTQMLNGIMIGLFMALVALVVSRLRHGRKGMRGPHIAVHSSIEDIRSIGELSVFKIITKEIVTATDHSFGEVGKRYLQWMVSARKMAMIISFDIDFRYNLRSETFIIDEGAAGTYRLTMPKCFYETHIRDIHFYDEQESKILPWLLPDLLNRAFGGRFTETDKNRLIEEAKNQASMQARDLVVRMQSEVQSSARETLAALARGFGAREVTIDFKDSELVQAKVDFESPEAVEAPTAV